MPGQPPPHRARRSRRAVRRARGAGLHADRPARARPGDRLRRDRTRAPTCPAGWTDVQDGGTLPPGARATTTRCSATTSARTRGRATCSRPRCDSGRRAGTTAGSQVDEERPSAAALRVHRRALLRPARDRGPGPDVPGGRLRRSRLPGPARGRVHRRGQLRAGRRRPASARRWTPARARAAGFDLALTELLDDGAHRFLVEVGSERGAEVLAELPHDAGRRPATRRRGRRVRARPPPQMGRTLDVTDIRDLLYRNREHPRWDEVADRCLTLRQLHDGLPDLLLRTASRT